MAAPVIPSLLRDGDRMGRDEFLRRWELMPDLKRAQLLDGIVYMASPLSTKHGSFHSSFNCWLAVYAARIPAFETIAEGTALIEQDAPQPDIALRILPAHGGQSRDEGLYLAGAPELIVEVAASSRARDLGPKARLYLQAGVREYMTALVREERVIWREFHEGAWRELPGDQNGILRSRVYPGLWLDEPAMWRRDMGRVLDALGQGLASAEHKEFVQSLAMRNAPPPTR